MSEFFQTVLGEENAIPMFSLQYQSYLNGTEDTSLFHLIYETISITREPMLPRAKKGIEAVIKDVFLHR